MSDAHPSPFRQTVQRLDEHFYTVFPDAKPPLAPFEGPSFVYDDGSSAYALAAESPIPQYPATLQTAVPLSYNYPHPAQNIAPNDFGSPAFPTSVQAADVAFSPIHYQPPHQQAISPPFLSTGIDAGYYTTAGYVAYSEPGPSNQVLVPQVPAAHGYRPYTDITAHHPITTTSPILQSPVLDARSPAGHFFALEPSPSSPPTEPIAVPDHAIGHTTAASCDSAIGNALQQLPAQHPVAKEPQGPSKNTNVVASRIPPTLRPQPYGPHLTPPLPHIHPADKAPARGSQWLESQAGPSSSSRQPSMRLSPLPSKRQLEKKPPLACLFCRGRKIACGPPLPGSPDKTCNQCQRRSLRCEYPAESRRGMRKKKAKDSADKGAKSPSTDNAGTESP